MTTPTRYYLTVSADIGRATLTTYVTFWDHQDAQVGESSRSDGTSFCFTWKDLVAWLEREFVNHGGVLNDAINRPSPFVDLT